MSSARTCAIGGSIGTGKCGELLCRPVAIAVSSNSMTDQKKHHLCTSSSKQQAAPRSSCGVNRRDAMLQMVVASSVSLLSCPATPAAMAADVLDDFRVYTDETNKFTISVPRDWKVGTGESDRIKLVTAFYPEEVPTSNISVVITGIGPDFTRLESFGKVDAFAENLVNGLDRSWQRPPGVTAKLLDSRASHGLYYIEYTLQNPGESRRHIYSAIGMATNGWYNRLYTVTGQFLEDEADKLGSKIEKGVLSFRLSS